MKINKIFIGKFKNLVDFSVAFDDETTTVLVGRNGTGKSNLLEALTLLFRDLDLRQQPVFKYTIEYTCNKYEIKVDADPDRISSKYITFVDGKKISNEQFWGVSDRAYLPRFIFGYYSGPSNRLEQHFAMHQEKFYRELIKERTTLKDVALPLRSLFYARMVHSQFVLLSFFVEQDDVISNFLRDHLRIENLKSVLFVIREPSWGKGKDAVDFWGAKGVVRAFLDKLQVLAFEPKLLNRPVEIAFRKTSSLDHWFFYLKDVQVLRNLASQYKNRQDFFKALESTYISELLSEVNIKVEARNVDGEITFQELSEGEQQLLMVLGLLRFTKEDESLFLLDEPDTHLNPAWSMQYLNFLRQIVGEEPNNHIILATHDPLVIAGLTRKQVKIMCREDKTGRISAEIPDQDPRGMGIAGLLTSDIYGLRSQLDLETLKLLDRKRDLAVKETLTNEEKTELAELNKQLMNLGFSETFRDPMFTEYVKAKTKLELEAGLQVPILSNEQQKQQKQLTKEVLKKIMLEKDSKS